MNPDWQLYRKNPELSLEILKTDADLALTFVRTATLLSDLDAIAQNVRRARRAYDYITEKLAELCLAGSDINDLDSKLVVLRSRLEELGEHF